MTTTATRKNKIAYYLLRADASKTFKGLFIKKVNRGGLTRYGILVSEPIAVPGQCAQIHVSWMQTLTSTTETLSRIELTGPSRIRKAAPSLSEEQRCFVCQVTSLEDQTTWGRIDTAADTWEWLKASMRSTPELRPFTDAIDHEGLSIGQKERIVKLHHALNPDMDPDAIAAHWAELGAIG